MTLWFASCLSSSFTLWWPGARRCWPSSPSRREISQRLREYCLARSHRKTARCPTSTTSKCRGSVQRRNSPRWKSTGCNLLCIDTLTFCFIAAYLVFVSVCLFLLWSIRHVFHYRVDDGLTFLCMADEDSRRRIPFAFLQEIKNRFQATYGDRCAFNGCREF